MLSEMLVSITSSSSTATAPTATPAQHSKRMKTAQLSGATGDVHGTSARQLKSNRRRPLPHLDTTKLFLCHLPASVSSRTKTKAPVLWLHCRLTPLDSSPLKKGSSTGDMWFYKRTCDLRLLQQWLLHARQHAHLRAVPGLDAGNKK
jgi:hypothetical protein